MVRIFLSALLGEARMTQTELSERTGIRLATINALYHEHATRVTLDDLDSICEVLDCEWVQLINRVRNNETVRLEHRIIRHEK